MRKLGKKITFLPSSLLLRPVLVVRNIPFILGTSTTPTPSTTKTNSFRKFVSRPSLPLGPTPLSVGDGLIPTPDEPFKSHEVSDVEVYQPLVVSEPMLITSLLSNSIFVNPVHDPFSGNHYFPQTGSFSPRCLLGGRRLG